MRFDEIEIRLFGSLFVRRADGTEVDPREWRTGKTADLLRLLALSSGQPVPVDAILDALWPDAERAKGLASLRTAACQIRRTLRQNCISRHYDGLMLEGVFVDVAAFAQLVGRGRASFRAQRWDDVISLTTEAEALYVADLGACDLGLARLDERRQDLRELRLQLLLDAADAAVEFECYPDGAEFAARAVEIDAFSERAVRALIRSHAGVGETHRALAAYARCRAALADELGVEPSRQTRELHLQLLERMPARTELRPKPTDRPDAHHAGLRPRCVACGASYAS